MTEAEAETAAELERLESNHAELLAHAQTLRRQLQLKTNQAKQLQAALAECRTLQRSLKAPATEVKIKKDDDDPKEDAKDETAGS